MAEYFLFCKSLGKPLEESSLCLTTGTQVPWMDGRVCSCCSSILGPAVASGLWSSVRQDSCVCKAARQVKVLAANLRSIHRTHTDERDSCTLSSDLYTCLPIHTQ